MGIGKIGQGLILLNSRSHKGDTQQHIIINPIDLSLDIIKTDVRVVNTYREVFQDLISDKGR